MKRLLMLALLTFTTASVALWAIPATINYQGSLKEKGLPVTATKQMLFRITDATGQQVYWSSPSIPVSVKNGLFSVPLTPTGVNWETTTPYIEVSVEGQMLLPREPLSTTVYAAVSNSVVDGAITPAKLSAATVGMTVPSGMIAMFDTACPAGWVAYSNLQGRFPVGQDSNNLAQFSLGQSAGSLAHTHSIGMDGAHSHTTPVTDHNEKQSVQPGTNNAEYSPFSAGWVPRTPAMTTSSSGLHNHSGATGASSGLPPYYSLLFCKKL